MVRDRSGFREASLHRRGEQAFRTAGIQDHRPNATSRPARTKSTFSRGSLDTRSISAALSAVNTCDTFATDSFGRPVTREDSNTLPSASAHRRLLVSGMQITVDIRLRLSSSPCTTMIGLGNPGSDPDGIGRSAHQISPCQITIRRFRESDERWRSRSLFPARLLRKRDSKLP
jgi:hypothetical protein